MALELMDIRRVWERVRPGLEQVARDMGADWRPEDIYALCVNRQASLYLAAEGFIILSKPVNEWTLEPYLFVVAAFAPDAPVQERYLEELESLARAAGAAYIECLSPRRGFERAGWTPEHVCYRRRV